MKGDLRALSRDTLLKQRLYVHLFGYPEHAMHPFNSLMNLARFYAPTESILLVPLLPLLPTLGQYLSSSGDEATGEIGRYSVVFLGHGLLHPHSQEFEASTAILLGQSSSPWCPGRFISTQDTQWGQCLWHAWLLSLGNFHSFSVRTSLDAIEAYKGTPTLPPTHILVRPFPEAAQRCVVCVCVLRTDGATNPSPNSPLPSPSSAVS